jgi:hypothetical protein
LQHRREFQLEYFITDEFIPDRHSGACIQCQNCHLTPNSDVCFTLKVLVLTASAKWADPRLGSMSGQGQTEKNSA